MTEQYTTLQRDTKAFLKNGGKITKLKSQLVTETARAENLKHEAARKRGMKKFNGGIEK